METERVEHNSCYVNSEYSDDGDFKGLTMDFLYKQNREPEEAYQNDSSIQISISQK